MKNTEEELYVIEKIKKDCKENGHGRKKWWAENLGIHQQTLSYWLHGKRRPRGFRVQQINNLSLILNKEDELREWRNFLFHLYYSKQEIPKVLLKECIKKVLTSSTVDSRTLGFLSYIIQKTDIEEMDDTNPFLKNRLGWLMEVSGRHAGFKPIKTKTMFFVRTPLEHNNPKTIAYLKKVQTTLGKRWNLYDCDISQIRSSFIGEFISTDS